jgi:hypothetical protein
MVHRSKRRLQALSLPRQGTMATHATKRRLLHDSSKRRLLHGTMTARLDNGVAPQGTTTTRLLTAPCRRGLTTAQLLKVAAMWATPWRGLLQGVGYYTTRAPPRRGLLHGVAQWWRGMMMVVALQGTVAVRPDDSATSQGTTTVQLLKWRWLLQVEPAQTPPRQ